MNDTLRILVVNDNPNDWSLIRHELSRQFPGLAIEVITEAQYRDFYEHAPDGYAVIDAAGVIKEMNATQLNWLGYGAEDVIDHLRYEDLLAPAGRRPFVQALERQQRDEPPESVDVDLVGKENRWLPVRVHLAVIRDAAGQYRGCRLTARDITKEKALEAQLLQAQKLESLGTLVGGIAHDFNNMLTGILGFTQLLLRDVEPEGTVYEGLQRIELFSERAANLVKQLLAFSRQEVGQKRALSLHSFLKEIGRLLERMIPENIEIELELASEDFTVEADPTQLQQVLMNLAVNARDAMPEGGWFSIGTARVELDEAFCQAHLDIQPGSYVRVSVSDTGMGIPPEIHSRIFDPFFTTKEMGKGTGLGLAVVYGIVKNHGGTIEVKSRAGGGTTFHIYWPLVEKAEEVVAPAPAQVRGGTETILLVEDEPTVLELGRTALEHFGYRVLTARDGLEGVMMYQQHRDEIALVILDVVMPKLGGRETLRELQRITPDVRVLLATGYGSSGASVGSLLQESVCGLVRKPFQIRELAQAVRAALDQQPVNELRTA